MKIELKKSSRARRLRVAVYCDGRCIITAPRFMPDLLINKFIAEKSQWIIDKIDFLSKFNYKYRPGGRREDYLKLKESAQNLAEGRVAHFNRLYNFQVNGVAIKNQKSRWGSCSRKGNLNFNYKIAFLPASLCDYIVVHELCHLAEFNHSRNFWGLVGKTIPDYKKIKKEFKSVK
jgi:predicted metal-dependent hydrolase